MSESLDDLRREFEARASATLIHTLSETLAQPGAVEAAINRRHPDSSLLNYDIPWAELVLWQASDTVHVAYHTLLRSLFADNYHIVSGDARYAEAMAEVYLMDDARPAAVFRAGWKSYGPQYFDIHLCRIQLIRDFGTNCHYTWYNIRSSDEA